MSLRRKITRQLEEWKRSQASRALLVTGARQVGKSYAVNEFASRSYENYVRFDLIEQPDLLAAMEGCHNADELFMVLSAFGGSRFVSGDTCVFIDEVQECKESVTYIKYLVQREGYDFILSGSLLGIELQDVRSQPVGYLRTIEMFPLDFEEFCWAMDVGDAALSHVKDCFDLLTPVIGPIHERLLSLFHQYLLVGGMPAAVNEFARTNNVAEVKRIQSDIVTLYRADISKYAETSKLVIKDVYDQLPAQLDSQSKRFNFASLAPKGTYGRYSEEFIWLSDAGVALPVVNVTEPRHPLKMSEQRSFFKLFANDVGLLCAMSEVDVAKSILSDELGVNYGSIYENVIAQELKCHGHKLRFFRSKGIGELDFVIETGSGQVLPIEVKSGKSYKRHSALTKVLSSPNYRIERAVVLCESNVSPAGKTLYLPVYMAMCL
ncbi:MULTISPECIES: ATP-binding protein [unclassified Adlercreutzia]|uniref:ATP-binding protein n=1 Tax=unclassified Adlercreutzia TaxID=2636013 RepID=UPI0013EC10B6|nr:MULTISPECIES: AAA family ATPase [unclassified Adlercreutzia]